MSKIKNIGTILPLRQVTIIFLSSFFFFLLEPFSDTQPNILYIMVDDLGKEWISSYGADLVETPNIDDLAAKGLKFNNAYSMPKCIATRTTLLSGRYPFNHGWTNHWDVPQWWDRHDGEGPAFWDRKYNLSVSRVMKAAGYRVAGAGKWQLHRFSEQPDAMEWHGFDDYMMWTSRGSRYWDPVLHSNEGTRTHQGEYGPELFLERMKNFLHENKHEPMFMYYSLCLPHGPLVTTTLKPNVTSDMQKQIAMVEYIDYAVGEIVSKTRELGIDSNTIIIFTTDNGTGSYMTGSLDGVSVKGGKNSDNESGINEPFIVYAPGIVPEGVETDELTDFTDLLPTFAELAGVSLDTLHKYYPLDGKSIVPIITGESQTTDRDWILAMGGGVSIMGDSGVTSESPYMHRVIRDQDYKVWVGTDRQINAIYNMRTDRWETDNLINSSNPEVVAALEKFEAIKATYPRFDNRPMYTNALFDPPLEEIPDPADLTLIPEVTSVGQADFPLTTPVHIDGSRISIKMPGEHVLEVFNIKGEQIFSEKGSGVSEYSLEGLTMKGVYLINVKANGRRYSFKIFMEQE